MVIRGFSRHSLSGCRGVWTNVGNGLYVATWGTGSPRLSMSCVGLGSGPRPRPAEQGKREHWRTQPMIHRSLQLGVLPLSLFEDRSVRIGIFPELQEVLVFGASLAAVTGERVGAAKAEMGRGAMGSFRAMPEWLRIFWNSAAAAAP